MPRLSNRRELYRFVGDMPARFRGRPSLKWQPCLVVDVSGSGIRIASPERLVDASEVQIEMTVSQRIYILDAVVVWLESNEDETWHKYGLAWFGLPEDDRDDLIRSLVAHQRLNRPRVW